MRNDDIEIRTGLASESAAERERAIDLIGESYSPAYLDMIVAGLADPNPDVRQAAAYNLGAIHDERAIPHLLQYCSSESDWLARQYAFYALAEYTDDTIRGYLIGELSRVGAPREAFEEIARQLRAYDTDDSVAALQLLFETDEHEAVRLMALDSLLTLNRSSLEPFWENLSHHPDSAIWEKAAQGRNEMQR